MSSATPPNQSPLVPDMPRLIERSAERFAAGVRATAFWTAALLPLVLLAALVAGLGNGQPTLLGGALVVNAVCVLLGHDYSPGS